MYTEAYHTYLRLQKELEELISKNLCASPAAEKVNNLMDALWPQLSETEQVELCPGIKLPFWSRVISRLFHWRFVPSKALTEIKFVQENGASLTLREILEKKRNEEGDEVALILLDSIISKITGSIG